ncbi:TPA: DUF916 and DUF3324 domain-containing protein [Enterococcus faecalis]
MKKLIRIIFFSLSIFTILCFNNIPSFAVEETGSYTIEGVPNKNQIDADLGYFYLHEDPGSEDSVKVKLVNTSNKDIKLQVKLTNANTNSNGIIDYTGQIKDHESLKVPLTSIAKVTQSEVVVPKQSEVESEIKIIMPNNKLSGVIIGGIIVSKVEDQNEQKKQNVLSNTYGYTLGLVLTNENSVDMEKNVSVKLDKVGPVLSNGKKIIQANILNANPFIFSKANIKGEIIDKDSNEVIKKEEINNVNIAPYSVFPMQFDWGKNDLKPGIYTFKGIVKVEDKEWKLIKDFEISKSNAKKINENSIYKISIPDWLRYSSYILLILSTCGTVFTFIKTIKKRKMGDLT